MRVHPARAACWPLLLIALAFPPSSKAVTYCSTFDTGWLEPILMGRDACAWHPSTFSDGVEACGDELLAVDGAPGESVTCEFCLWAETGTYQNELGIVPLDEIAVDPGDPAWRAAVLTAPGSLVIFAGAGSPDGPGTTRAVDLEAGRAHVFWLVANSTRAEALGNAAIPVFYSISAANPDGGIDHLKVFGSASNGDATAFAWEDLWFGGDFNYADLLFTTRCAFGPPPCAVSALRPPRDAAVCAGGSATLDASGVVVRGCNGTTLYEWSDGAGVVGTSATLTVTPDATTDFSVTVSCSTASSCAATMTATVAIEAPPLPGLGGARELADCNLGIELTWDAATFRGPTGRGHYNVYRGTIDCADALRSTPVARGLTSLRWVDTRTEPGRRYRYLIEAEDDTPASGCPATGPSGGAVAWTCLDPVTESLVEELPVPVCAALRAVHEADVVELTWAGARTLGPDEHFNLRHAADDPTAAFELVTPEGFRDRSFVHVDTRSPLQFYDLRAATPCELESRNEYPAPGLLDAVTPCP